jgi:hypothetical protein
MADAIMQPNETVDAWVAWHTGGAGGPGQIVHPYVDEGLPPGDFNDWYACSGVAHFAKLKFGDVPADFERTGASGFRVAYYYKSQYFTLYTRVYVQGFISGAPVTNNLMFAINSAIPKTVAFNFPETEITANWDGSKGYLTAAEMNDLMIHFDYQNGVPGDIDPPEWP